jgi:hypothetical protein
LIPLHFVIQLNLRLVIPKRNDLSRIGFEDFIERLDTKASIRAEPCKPPRYLRIDGYVRGLVVIFVLDQIRSRLSNLRKSLKAFRTAFPRIENLLSLRKGFEVYRATENVEARVAVGLGLCIQAWLLSVTGGTNSCGLTMPSEIAIATRLVRLSA